MPWREINQDRWVRDDGAVVMWDRRTPNSNPCNPRALMWTAWEPDPSESAIMRTFRNSRFRSPRRFGSALTAMMEVDRQFPEKR